MRGGGLGGEGLTHAAEASTTVTRINGNWRRTNRHRNKIVDRDDIGHYVQVLTALYASLFIFSKFSQSGDRCMDYFPPISPDRFLHS